MSQSNPDADYALKFRQACQGPSQENSQAGKPSSRRLCPDAPAGVLSAIARRWHSLPPFSFLATTGCYRGYSAKVTVELQLQNIDQIEVSTELAVSSLDPRQPTNAAAAPDVACVISVIRFCAEYSHRDLCIRHDQMHHSHACFRGSAAIPHALEQTRTLPGTGSVGVASDE